MTSVGLLLRPEPFERYRRDRSLPGLGVQEQWRLSKGRLLPSGAEGLGCPLAQNQAAAGIGRIGSFTVDAEVPRY